MKTLNNSAITTIIIAISAVTPTFSQENSNKNEVTGNRRLSVGIGFPAYSLPFQGQLGPGTGLLPEYEGSDNYGATLLPLIDIRQPGRYFLKGASINVNDGIASAGLTIVHFSYSEGSDRPMQIIVGPLVSIYRGRDESDNDILDGLGDIEQNVAIGGFLEFRADPWLASISVSPQDVGNDQDGVLMAFDVEYTTSVSTGFKMSTGLSTSWANAEYLQGYFGVTDAQAAQAGLPPFYSKAGLKDIGLQIKTSYALSPGWSIDGQLGYWRLLNDAADSPIVKDEGSADQVCGLIGISFQF